MATADEILATMSAEEEKAYLVIESDLRTITIPDEIKILGVESDDDVLRLHFKMPKMYGEFDLSEFELRVNYMNAGNEPDLYEVKDAAVSGDIIEFSWLVGRTAAKYKGDVKFIVCAKLIKADGVVEKEFNTTTAKLPVLEGLETSEAVVQLHPDIIEAILLRLSMLETSGGVTDEQIANALSEYLAENPVQPGATQEQAEQIQANKEAIEELQKNGTGGAAIDDITPSATTTYSSTKIDALLNEQKEANAAQDERLSTLERNTPSGTSGLTVAQINALDAMFQKCAYSGDVTAEYDAFKTAFGIVSLTSITAVYSGDSVTVGTDVTTLTGITVTANYSDGKSVTVTGYTITGEIVEGTNTLTIGYGGKYTTITVVGVDDGSEPVTMTSITAAYTGGNVPVGTALTALTGITVTATYSDGSTAAVTGYTLSGEIAEGENTITVSYGTFTSTITVTGYAVTTDEEWTVVREIGTSADAYPYVGILNSTHENGVNSGETGWKTTDYIEVPDGATSISRITSRPSDYYGSWYDTDKNYIGEVFNGTYSGNATYGGGYTDENGVIWIAVPSTAKYIRVSCRSAENYTSLTFMHNPKLDESVMPVYGKLYHYTYDAESTDSYTVIDDYLKCSGMAYAQIRPILRRSITFYGADYAEVSEIATANSLGNNVVIPTDAVYMKFTTINQHATAKCSFDGVGLIKFTETELTAW